MKFYRFLFWILLIVFLSADRLSKWLVLSSLKEGQSISVIPNIFHITLVKNTGLAFGLLQGGLTYLFAAVSFVMIIILLYIYFTKKPDGYLVNAAMGLICAGAAGNLIDRIFFGQVIDFLDFRIWPVFNIADSSIFVGVAILILIYTFAHEEVPVKG